ncbi:metal-sensitive transcriptional regulator [Parvularcula oceani]|uniref:metal-sensitive transcriptional regulator n=1 Tax=Parvularcula oceani TaxID=1247963 RepID=UPI000560C484|nr:metal-sensitive transcriptional regulator [Parvularcula oceani]
MTSPDLALERRLNRVEGRVRGIKQMIADDRPCAEVLDQIAAANSALRRVAVQLLRQHALTQIKLVAPTGEEGAPEHELAAIIELADRQKR